MLSVEIVSTTTTQLKHIILGLGTYSFAINALSKKNCTMRRGTRNPRKLKMRHYTPFMIKLNEYLDAFPGAQAREKIGET